jgi:hypothetical protein
VRLLDLFCGVGLAADGWVMAGYDPVGVDIDHQVRYPRAFFWEDALALLAGGSDDWLETFDVISASPPCQMHTRAKSLRASQGRTARYGDLLTPTIELLRERWNHKTWVVENVPGSPGMGKAVQCCGSAFGLGVQRHRLFLSNQPLVGTRCHHERFEADPLTGRPRPWGVYHTPGDIVPSGGRTCFTVEHAREVMGVARAVPWDELTQGYPPVYAAHIGSQLRWLRSA